jgi:hypothetical protein
MTISIFLFSFFFFLFLLLKTIFLHIFFCYSPLKFVSLCCKHPVKVIEIAFGIAIS